MIDLDLAGDYRTLIIEGCDGAGKTTLARYFARRCGFTLVHSPRTPDHENLISRYRDLLDRPGRLLLDRSFLSELVYGPLYRGRSRVSWAQALDLAEHATQRDGCFLHLYSPPAIVSNRLVARDGQAPSIEEIEALLAAYQQVFDALADYCPVRAVNTAQLTLPASDESSGSPPCTP